MSIAAQPIAGADAAQLLRWGKYGKHGNKIIAQQ
jgi:hypothetical protein